MARTSRTELVSLTRGFFACPVVIGLAEAGVLSRMRQGPFTIDELPSGNRPVLVASVEYLRSVGLVEELEVGQGYSLTRLGDVIVDRVGFFQLMHSYRDYFADFSRLLSNSSSGSVVRRLENVTGTGQIHARKFFPRVLDWIEGRAVNCVADIGCGNGEFLSAVMGRYPEAFALGVDLSPEAVRVTEDRLVREYGAGKVRGVIANAQDIRQWSQCVPDQGKGTVITLWFVVHEFSGGMTDPVVDFFHKLHALLPSAVVIVGEIVSLPLNAMANSHLESVYPEILLFHSLSGQGPLSWEQHSEWLSNIPYKVVEQVAFDELPHQDGRIPSSCIWMLQGV